ncbi:acyl carrier protein [Streptomyces sp. NPDC047515]|uniref:acyl carrier protein n=1 Tax=Streptomyces sp. NPDC047515 TaxID=3155380 RepID=UPI00340C3BDE
MSNPTHEQLYDRLVAVLQYLHDAPAEQLTPDATYAGLGVDSLTMVEISMRLERELGVEVADDELSQDLSLAETVRLIESKLSADGPLHPTTA